MARIRTVKPKFWDDIKLSKISRDARLLFIGMWNFADDCGVIMGEPVWIKSKIFPYDNLTDAEFDKMVKELRDISVIVPGVFREEIFYLIKNFNRHQVINKPNNDGLFIPKDCISNTFENSNTATVIITEQSGNSTVALLGGREGNRKGREEEGKGGEITVPIPENEKSIVFYDAEKLILDNQIQFENICMAAQKKDRVAAKESLRKFHLFLEERDKYPQNKKQIFAGFEKWLLNEKTFNNGTHKQSSSGSGTRTTKSTGAENLITSLKNDLNAGGK